MLCNIILTTKQRVQDTGWTCGPSTWAKSKIPGYSYVQARSAHQPAAPAKAGDVVQDRQPAAIFGGNTEAQTPELDVAWGRIHAQARTVLPGRPLRGPSVQAFHDLVRTGQAARPQGQLSQALTPLGLAVLQPLQPPARQSALHYSPLAKYSFSALPPCPASETFACSLLMGSNLPDLSTKSLA